MLKSCSCASEENSEVTYQGVHATLQKKREKSHCNQAVCEQHRLFYSTKLVITISLFTIHKSDVKEQSTFTATFLRLTQQGKLWSATACTIPKTSFTQNFEFAGIRRLLADLAWQILLSRSCLAVPVYFAVRLSLR